VIDIKPGYFYSLGSFVHALVYIRKDTPDGIRADIFASAHDALTNFTSNDDNANMFPKTTEKGKWLLNTVGTWATWTGKHPDSDYVALRDSVNSFATTLADELENTFNYALTPKGNLSLKSLVAGASRAYPARVLALIDDFVKSEIDAAGKCLACASYTACGFHILRSVEISVMAYVLAASGELPKPQKRSWGTYIQLLLNAGAHSDLIDVLRILKTKRNPLMHPEDRLDEGEAIHLFCICEATMSALIEDVKIRTDKQELKIGFKDALHKLPELARAAKTT
jgi:hypothetical protein